MRAVLLQQQHQQQQVRAGPRTWQFIAQPTWLLTHSVMWLREPRRCSIGISTASTLPPLASPSVDVNTSLRVPSLAGTTRCSSRPPSTLASGSTLSQNDADSPFCWPSVCRIDAIHAPS